MILWSMILKIALWAVEFTRRATETACFDGVLLSVLRKRLKHWLRGLLVFVLVPLGWKSPANCCCTTCVLQVSDLTIRADGKIGCQRHLYCLLCSLDSQINMRAQFVSCFQSNNFSIQTSCQKHEWEMSKYHKATIGFNETIRNWHEERYVTSFSRGIGIQFSTSNNTTSLNDHWLVYRHCAKLRHWGKVEKFHLPYQ